MLPLHSHFGSGGRVGAEKATSSIVSIETRLVEVLGATGSTRCAPYLLQKGVSERDEVNPSFLAGPAPVPCPTDLTD
jgi:hypothetical protein